MINFSVCVIRCIYIYIYHIYHSYKVIFLKGHLYMTSVTFHWHPWIGTVHTQLFLVCVLCGVFATIIFRIAVKITIITSFFFASKLLWQCEHGASVFNSEAKNIFTNSKAAQIKFMYPTYPSDPGSPNPRMVDNGT